MSERERENRERDRYRYRYDIDIDRKKEVSPFGGAPRRFYDDFHKNRVMVNIKKTKRKTYAALKEILAREGKSFSAWVLDNAESYVVLHEAGNPQQRIDTVLKIGKAYHAPGRICGFKDCMRDAVGVALYIPRGEEYGYCSVHIKDIKEHIDLWKVLK